MIVRDGGSDAGSDAGGNAGKDRYNDRYAGAAARLLVEQREACGDDALGAHDPRRDAVVAAMALAIAGRARRKRIVLASTLTLAAAAASVAVVFGLSTRSPTALVVERVSGRGNVLVHMAATQSLLDRQPIVAGDSVRSGDEGTASLGFANGTNVVLASASSLRVDEVGPTRRFFLSSGGIKARVSKLARGERFVVDTPDSEVEVRGTVFSVDIHPSSPACAGGTTSSIDVSEGTVWVRSGEKQVVLRAGESWITPCPTPLIPDELPAGTAERATAVAPGPAAAPVRSAARRPPARRPTSSVPRAELAREHGPREMAPPAAPPVETRPASVSHLAEQNDLFSAAMAAERLGQHAVALRKLDELLTRFPDGPLAESARGQRQRILSTSQSR